jgi:hypothetical protein
MFLRSVLQLRVTTDVAPSARILFTLTMEAIISSNVTQYGGFAKFYLLGHNILKPIEVQLMFRLITCAPTYHRCEVPH